MEIYNFSESTECHRSDGFITKDGHTMFLDDVVCDINYMQNKITALEQKNAELERQIAGMKTKYCDAMGMLRTVSKARNPFLKENERLQRDVMPALEQKLEKAKLRNIQTSDYEQAVQCCEDREKEVLGLKQQLSEAQEVVKHYQGIVDNCSVDSIGE